MERSIRAAIHQAWGKDPALWQRYFPGLESPPTGKAFICQMVHFLDEA